MSREGYRCRAVSPRDRPGILRVLQDTLMLGQPLPQPVMDLDLTLAFFTDYFLTHEPEAGLVVVDPADRVVGYMLGTTRAREHARWQNQASLALAWRWLRHWPRYDAFTRHFYRLRLRDVWESTVHPAPPQPGFYHWHLLPEVRGHWGRTFAVHFGHHAYSRGLASIGGDYPLLESRKGSNPFRRLGGEVVHRVPHHTLSALLGVPVQRITVAVRLDQAHW